MFASLLRFLSLLMICPNPALAALISSIQNAHTLAISLDQPCEIGDIYAISAQEEENQTLGFGTVVGKEATQCLLNVHAHSQSGIIRVGDKALWLDLTKRNSGFSGRQDLLIEGKRHYSSRYKPLVHLGQVYGQSAATLDKGEFLIGLAQAIYGITDQLQIDTYPVLHFVGISAFGLKYKLFQNENFRISPQAQIFGFTKFGGSAYDYSLNLDSLSNSQSATHTRLSFLSKRPEDGLPLADDNQRKQFTAELTSLYEWILTSWDRILFGPKFSKGAESELGFVFTTVIVYDRFHWSAGVEANSLTSINFRKKKQVFNIDLFWRL